MTRSSRCIVLAAFCSVWLVGLCTAADDPGESGELVDLGYSISYPVLQDAEIDSTNPGNLKQTTIVGTGDLDGYFLVTPSDDSFESYVTNSTGNLAAATGLVNLGSNTELWAILACFYNADATSYTASIEIGAYSNSGGYPGTLLTSVSGSGTIQPGANFATNCHLLYFVGGAVTAPSSLFLAISYSTDYGNVGLLADSDGPPNTTYAAFGVPYYNATWLPVTGMSGIALYAVVADGSTSSNCVDDLDNGIICLRDDRFELSMTWTDFQNTTSPVVFERHTDQVSLGVFQNNLDDVTLVAKVTNGCPLNGNYWVWLGAFTGAKLDLRVRDTVTNRVQNYGKPLGGYMTTLKDDSSFPCN
jgi:hypothetical protein